MFLTKKARRKLMFFAVVFFLLGTYSIGLGYFSAAIGLDTGFLIVPGIAMYCVGIISTVAGYYREAKKALLLEGISLVRDKLKPAEFIDKYLTRRYYEPLVVNKPGFELLYTAVVAFDTLNDRENSLKAVDELITVAPPKKKTLALLAKASLLYSYNQTAAAERIYNECLATKLNTACREFADAVGKNDRAKALGDYRTVEAYNLNLLDRTVPKQDNLSKLVIHHTLGEVYELMGEKKNALEHYRYCVDNCGETAMRITAAEAIQRLTK